jgi:NHLM bacteriocin system ABC transporter ATP-binding protein
MAVNVLNPSIASQENLELFLLDLRYREGRLVQVENNRPVLLNDKDSAWIVYSGVIDVFVVPLKEGRVDGTRRHLFRSRTGQLLLGVSGRYGNEMGVLVTGTPGSRLLQLPLKRLKDLTADMEYSEFIEAMLNDWVIALSTSVSSNLIPRDHVLLSSGSTISIKQEQVALPQKGILWVRVRSGDDTCYLDNPGLRVAPNGHYLPLSSKHTWLRSLGNTELETADTKAFLTHESLWHSLAEFHELIFEFIRLNQNEEAAAEKERLLKQAEAEQAVMERALYRLATPLASKEASLYADVAEDTQNNFLAAAKLVGKAIGVFIKMPPGSAGDQTLGELFKGIARASGIRVREVSLRGAWWNSDNGPILGFLSENQRAVALLPGSTTSYELHDPVARQKRRVTEAVAKELLPHGFAFYRPFPSRLVTAWELLKFGSFATRSDLIMVLIMGVFLGLLGLLPPEASRYIFDVLIPQGNKNTLWMIGIGLFLLALVTGLFQYTRGIAMMRASTKMDVSIQAALWDRLMTLPLRFFRNYSAGDLGMRAMGITTIRRTLSGPIITTVLTSIFSIFNLVLLFTYSTRLAFVALAIVLVAFVITVTGSILYIRRQRVLTDLQGEVSGKVLQLLTGVSKFRVTGAENQAFLLWSELFSKQKQHTYTARGVTNVMQSFNSAYPTIASLVLFAVIINTDSIELSIGDFVAFYVAFIQFLSAWLTLGTMLMYILTIIPMYERLKPILTAQPEADEAKLAPSQFSGQIEVSHVSFRYQENGPQILKDVSLSIQPGEFVALVGPSGSGKSTLFRLLLGFEKAESGGIYYDDQDLGDLDVRLVRQQIGVVLQNSTLMSGDIFTNIVGSSPDLTIDDAWEAARMAGLENDLKDMPMGMHTVVSERGSNFSGGQRQRLLIARALVNKPRLLYFDEATSALDNRTQDIVSRSLESIQATRVVIAHRLSTIINADRIYVLEGGRLVQSGTYAELMKQPGPFAELAKRQVV